MPRTSTCLRGPVHILLGQFEQLRSAAEDESWGQLLDARMPLGGTSGVEPVLHHHSRHADPHASPSNRFSSSQCSPSCTTPSPHLGPTLHPGSHSPRKVRAASKLGSELNQ